MPNSTPRRKLTDYVIYRHGIHPDNQPLLDKAPICIISARSQEEAINLAQLSQSVYPNQSFKAVPASIIGPGDWRYLHSVIALNQD